MATQVQKEVVAEFNVPEKALHAYRCAANKHCISLYVKYNRAREGELKVGDKAPNVSLISLEEYGTASLQSLLEIQQTDRPLVIVAGNIS